MFCIKCMFINMCVKSIMKWINYSYIFLLMIRSSCSGEHQVLCPSQKVLGLAGERVILPCQVHPPVDMHNKKIEWSRAQLEPRFVHLFNLDPGEDPDSSVSELFHYRTSVFEDELSKGNISLAIPHVALSDEGTFTCSAPQFRSAGESCSIKLSVVEISMPSISVIGLADGGLTLSCDSGCWYPEPEVTWLDGEGNLIPVQHSLTMAPEPSCHHSQTVVTVTRSANLTCRVRLLHMNHSYSYETHSVYSPGGISTVHISEGVVSGCGVARAAIICFGVVMSSALLAAFCFCRRGGKWRKQWPRLCQVELPGESLLGVSSTAELDTDVMLVASSSNVEVSDSQRTADQVEVQSVSPPPNREQTLALQRMASSMESMQSTWTHLSAVISTAANELTKREGGGVSRAEEKHE